MDDIFSGQLQLNFTAETIRTLEQDKNGELGHRSGQGKNGGKQIFRN